MTSEKSFCNSAGKHLAEEILKSLEDLGIPVEDMRGQVYDGAPNMFSQHVGVQARIRENSPFATYIHYSGHCLNLVIAHSCALPEVRNVQVLDKLKNCCMFFQKSAKRNGLLELVVSKGVGEETKRKALLDLCRTRWLCVTKPIVVVVVDLPLLRVAVERSDNPISLEKPCQASLPPDQQGHHSLGRHPEVQYIVGMILGWDLVRCWARVRRVSLGRESS